MGKLPACPQVSDKLIRRIEQQRAASRKDSGDPCGATRKRHCAKKRTCDRKHPGSQSDWM